MRAKSGSDRPLSADLPGLPAAVTRGADHQGPSLTCHLGLSVPVLAAIASHQASTQLRSVKSRNLRFYGYGRNYGRNSALMGRNCQPRSRYRFERAPKVDEISILFDRNRY